MRYGVPPRPSSTLLAGSNFSGFGRFVIRGVQDGSAFIAVVRVMTFANALEEKERVDGADAPAFTAPAARARRADRGTDRLRDKRRRRRGARGWPSR